MGKIETLALEDRTVAEMMTVGEYLKRKMQDAHLSPAELAGQIDAHVQTIYNVINGTRSVSANLALKLARYFPEPADFWLSDGIAEADAVFGAPSGSPPPQARLIDREIRAWLEQTPTAISPYDPGNIEPASYGLSVGLVIERGFKELEPHEWMLALQRAHDPQAVRGEAQARLTEKLERRAGAITYSDRVTLDPRDSAMVLMRETVRLDENHFGMVENTAQAAIRGLMFNGFQVDPDCPGIFVRMMNAGEDAVELGAGDRIASLAITRLAEPTDHAVARIDARTLHITSALKRVLAKLFQYEMIGDGVAVEAEALGIAFVGDTREDAERQAAAAIVTALKRPQPATADALGQAIQDSLRRIIVDEADAKALIRTFQISDPAAIGEAERAFRDMGGKQTAYHTLVRLRLDPVQFVLRMME